MNTRSTETRVKEVAPICRNSKLASGPVRCELLLVCTHTADLQARVPLSNSSTCRRSFCKAEVWSERAHACRGSTDRINTSKVEIKPQQSETLSLPPQRASNPDKAPGGSGTFPEDQFGLLVSRTDAHTDTHSLRNIYTGGHTLSITMFHTQFPDPLQAAGFLQPPIYCELPPVQSEAGVNTAGDPSHFSLFRNYFPSRICSRKKKQKNKLFPTQGATNRRCNKTILFSKRPLCLLCHYEQVVERESGSDSEQTGDMGNTVNTENEEAWFNALHTDEARNLRMLPMHCKSSLCYAVIIFYANCLSAATESPTYSCCRRNMAPVCRPASYVKPPR